MLLLERPPKPADFDDKMGPHRNDLKALVAAGKGLSFHDDAWQAYKPDFKNRQHKKCGYCEAKVVTEYGVIEHYRPKSAASRLNDLTGSKPRSTKITSGPLQRGYWWLAYEWTNWLFACTRCNTVKGSIFPLASDPQGDGEGVVDKPLLMNPFEKDKPGDHLKYSRDPLGGIGSETPMGIATIRTLGLDRDELREDREEIARDAYYYVGRVQKRMDADVEPRMSDLRNILALGDEKKEYAGMVRTIFEREIPIMTWAELESIFA